MGMCVCVCVPDNSKYNCSIHLKLDHVVSPDHYSIIITEKRCFVLNHFKLRLYMINM